ncbi:MAG TPA: molybdate ABC transporter substrate-binding protein [Bryobacteraceae bacterium]|nr:molybdate ABC transporter substrate-binding protein [Bryobacteraceae bacterium]
MRKGAVLVVALLSLAACRTEEASNSTPQPEVTIAAAANLTDVFQRVGARFEQTTGIHPVFSFASTAQLAQQIENGAPFDVFAAADAQHVEELDRKGLLLSGSRAVYARGILALWIPPHSQARIDRIEDLAKTDVRFIAIAKPELAPYGEAAVETLQRLNLWQRIQGKIVYAENINMARQYGMSNNADAVFTAYSLVLHAAGRTIVVDQALHPPIEQELGIMATSKHPASAHKFADFLLHGEGRDMLRNSGYAL